MKRMYEATVSLGDGFKLFAILNDPTAHSKIEWAIKDEQANEYCLFEDDKILISLPDNESHFCHVEHYFSSNPI